jgi:hypothetical protein
MAPDNHIEHFFKKRKKIVQKQEGYAALLKNRQH